LIGTYSFIDILSTKLIARVDNPPDMTEFSFSEWNI